MSATANAPGTLLRPELSELQRQIAAVKADAPDLVNGLKEAQFNWRPDSASWSIAECLLHLNIIGERYVRVLEPVLEEAAARGTRGQGSFRHGLLSRWILDNTEPPPRQKFKAPRSFKPAWGQPINAVLPTFLHLQDQLTRLIEQSNGLDLLRVKVPAPGLGPVRLNLYVTLAWIAAHERRHLWQARRVRNHAAFPQLGSTDPGPRQ